jgi:hypothetical protein
VVDKHPAQSEILERILRGGEFVMKSEFRESPALARDWSILNSPQVHSR